MAKVESIIKEALKVKVPPVDPESAVMSTSADEAVATVADSDPSEEPATHQLPEMAAEQLQSPEPQVSSTVTIKVGTQQTFYIFCKRCALCKHHLTQLICILHKFK